MVGQLTLGAFGFETDLQFGVTLPFLVRVGFHAESGERVELRRPVVAGPSLQALELGPFIIRQPPGLGPSRIGCLPIQRRLFAELRGRVDQLRYAPRQS
ncbi:hypothetical protein D3C81_1987110 [compost metagenome]